MCVLVYLHHFPLEIAGFNPGGHPLHYGCTYLVLCSAIQLELLANVPIVFQLNCLIKPAAITSKSFLSLSKSI